MLLRHFLIFLAVCLGLAPNAMSAPTSVSQEPEPKNCGVYTFWPNTTGIYTERDFAHCQCLDQCLDRHLFKFLNPANKHAYSDITFTFYKCGLNCFEPDFTPLHGSPTSPIADLQVVTNLTEKWLFATLLARNLREPFKELVIDLNKTLARQDWNVSKTFLNESSCYERLLRGLNPIEEADLEETFYCLESLLCLENLVHYIYTHEHHGLKTIPTKQYWQFYECTREAFLEANPARKSVTIKSAAKSVKPNSVFYMIVVIWSFVFFKF